MLMLKECLLENTSLGGGRSQEGEKNLKQKCIIFNYFRNFYGIFLSFGIFTHTMLPVSMNLIPSTMSIYLCL